MHFGNWSSRRSPHDATCSSRAPSVERGTRALAIRYGLNAKTVAKSRKRTSIAGRPMGPSQPESTVLSEIEEADVIEFRRRRPAAARRCARLLARDHPCTIASALHRGRPD